MLHRAMLLKSFQESLNLIFKSINNPITPNTNNTPSTTKIVLVETYPSLKINDIINEKNGGLNKSEYPVPMTCKYQCIRKEIKTI